MKVSLESTSKIVELRIGNEVIPARVWEGKTERGVPVFAFITRIAPSIENPGADVCTEFARDLEETRAPSPDLDRAIPARLLL